MSVSISGFSCMQAANAIQALNTLCSHLLFVMEPCVCGEDIVVVGLEAAKRPLLALLEEQARPATLAVVHMRLPLALSCAVPSSALAADGLAVPPAVTVTAISGVSYADYALLQEVLAAHSAAVVSYSGRLKNLSTQGVQTIRGALAALELRKSQWQQSIDAVMKLYV
jgi:hypothetical protein